MKTQHTPGPWRWEQERDTQGNITRHFLIGGPKMVTIVIAQHVQEDALPLLAAAPELKRRLAALLRADEMPPSPKQIDLALEAMADARALLARLEGGV